MLQQYLRKKAVLANAVVNSCRRSNAVVYDAESWWDKSFYVEGISDRQTIHANKHRLSAKYHYCSVEAIILRHLFNRYVQKSPSIRGAKATDSNLLEDFRILDVGSGSGYWIDFYMKLGAEHLAGLDVSATSVKYLRNKYSNHRSVTIAKGAATSVGEKLDGPFNLVNAIGVMFHITDDREWENTVTSLSREIDSRGLFIIGGHFGWLDGLNTQIDELGQINKRLRSFRRWKKVLRLLGFKNISLYRNYAYLLINDPLPENSILIAEKA